MRTAELVTGRSVVVVLEQGDEVLSSLREACVIHSIVQGYVPVLSGAFREVELIAAHTPVDDEEVPLPQRVTVRYAEGSGSGTIMHDEALGTAEPHLHLSVGVKNDGGAGYAGHLVRALAHYTVELVVTEVLSPVLARVTDPLAHGIPTLHPRLARGSVA